MSNPARSETLAEFRSLRLINGDCVGRGKGFGTLCLDKMPSLVDSGLTYDGSGFTTDWSRRFRNRAVTEQVLM